MARQKNYPALRAGQIPPLFVPAPLPTVYRSMVEQRWAIILRSIILVYVI